MIPIPTLDNIDDILVQIVDEHGPLQDGIALRWWPMTGATLRNRQRLDALAMIGGSVGISARQVHTLDDGAERLELAHASCVRTGAVLTLNYSPWHYYWDQKDARGWDYRAAKEIEAMSEAFRLCRDLLEKANRKSLKRVGKEARVDMVFLDQEILRADLDDNGKPDPFGAGVQDDQAAALRMKNNLAWEIAKEHFPGVTTVYHGQLTGSHHVDGEYTDGVAGAELYIANQKTGMEAKFRELLTEVDRANGNHRHAVQCASRLASPRGIYDKAQQEIIDRTIGSICAHVGASVPEGQALATICEEWSEAYDPAGVLAQQWQSETPNAPDEWQTIMPWIGIGGFYRHGYGMKPGWEDGEPYMPGLTWAWAREAMYPYFRKQPSGRPDYKRAKLFGIWPARNDLRWWTHFIAMVCGAHNIKEFEGEWPARAA